MPVPFRPIFALLAACSLCSGCAQRDLQPKQPGLLPAPLVPPVVVASEAGVPSPDLSALGTPAELEQRLPRRPKEIATRELLAEETQSLAAANSKLANLFDLEGQAVAHSAGNHKKTARLAALQQQLLCLRAIHERNQSAGQALQAFYKLAEVRGSAPALAAGQSLLDQMQADLRKVNEEGLKVTADRTALARQRLQLQDQHEQLELADAQLSEQLRGLIGLQPGEPTRLIPQANLILTVESIDVDQAISVGLSTRADLAALRLLLAERDAQTLPAARSGLSQTDPALGISAPAVGRLLKLVRGDTAACELEKRRAQLTELLETREQQVASEIRLAVREMETRLRQAALAAETSRSWQERLSNLAALREVGAATPLELQQTRLELNAADSALLKQAVAWRLAQVKLKEAQGLLAAEAGYDIGICLADDCP